jgi:DNA-binding transcriptional regulator YiaG
MTSKELRAALRRLAMSQADAARYLGVSPGAVSLWMHGRREIPGPVVKLIEMALTELETPR